jgi:hypothetical protein
MTPIDFDLDLSSSGMPSGGSSRNRVWALGGWDGSTAVASAIGAGIEGSAVNGFSVIAAFQLASVPAAEQYIVNYSDGVPRGYILGFYASAATIDIVANGATLGYGTSSNFGSSDVGKIHVLGLSTDTVDIRTFLNRSLVGTVAYAGYQVPVSSRMYVGSFASGQPMTDVNLLGICGRNSGLSLADFQAVCDATKSAGRFSVGAVTFDHLYQAPQSPIVPATIPDLIGSSDLTFVIGSSANLASTTVPNLWAF